VLRQAAVLTGIGVVAGVIGAAALSRYLEGLLFGLTPLDLTTFAAVVMMFGAVAMVASYVPARPRDTSQSAGCAAHRVVSGLSRTVPVCLKSDTTCEHDSLLRRFVSLFTHRTPKASWRASCRRILRCSTMNTAVAG
jgi:hypothetical protein